MEAELTHRKATATVIGSAGLFAAAFWILDAGTAFWSSNSGFSTALVPEGSQFLTRVMYATLFAVAGWIAGSAVQRSHDIEEDALARLTNSKRKYWALLTSTFDGVLTLDKDVRIVDASESLASLLGSQPTKLKGTSLDQFIKLDDAQSTSSGHDRSISKRLKETDGNVECCTAVTVQGQHDRVFPAEIRVSTMPEGQESAYLLALRETTASLVAKKSQQHEERRYQAMFENIPGGVYRGAIDGRLLAANPALASMLGYDSVAELLEAADTRSIFLDAQERKSLAVELERQGKARNFQLRLRRRDGSAVSVLANIQAVGHASREGLVYEGILTDISDLQAAHETLLDSEEYFRELCEHSLDVITVIDPAGNIKYSSPSSKTLSSRSPAEQVGLSLLRNVHPDDIDAVRQIIADGFERPGTAQHFTCRLIGADGTLRKIDAVGTAFMTRRGHLRAVIHSREVPAGENGQTQSGAGGTPTTAAEPST